MTRPTRTERNAVDVARQTKRRVKRVTKGRWNFEKAVKECVHRNFVPHADAEAHWNAQTIKPSVRKMLMADNRVVVVNHIMTGHSKAIRYTSEEKAASDAKCAATHLARGLKQKNWMEAACWVEAITTLDSNRLLDIMPVLDGLGADLLLRIEGTELWAPIQVKSAIVHDDENTNYGIYKSDGDRKYKNMIILAVGVSPVRDCKAETVNHVPDVTIQELFLYNCASDFPFSYLGPTPRRTRDDKYSDCRFVVGFDSEERFEKCSTICTSLYVTMPSGLKSRYGLAQN
jgi:hypothetical protein